MPVIRNWTNQEQILPIALKSFEINSSLLQAPRRLKEYVNQYREKRKLLDLQEKTSEEKQNEQTFKFRTFITSFYSRYIGILSSTFDSDCDFSGNLYDKWSIKIEKH